MGTDSHTRSDSVGQLLDALRDSQALIEIAMQLADEMTLLDHTIGLTPEAQAVLRDFDGRFLPAIRANKALLASVDGSAA